MFRTRTFFTLAAALAAALLGVCPVASAAADPRFTFTAVADQTTPVPGGTGTFLDFAGILGDQSPAVPSHDHGSVVFVEHGPASRYGVYRWEGEASSAIVDTATPIPGRTEMFHGFGLPVVSGGNVAFEAFDTQGRSLVLTRPGGDLTVIAGAGSAVPDGLGTFSDAARPTLWNDEVSFVGRYGVAGTSGGVFRYRAGTMSTVARSGMPVPGRAGQQFINFALTRGDRGDIAFQATTSQSGGSTGTGVYRTAGDQIVTVLDRSTPTPDNPPHSLAPEFSVDFDGTDTVFVADDVTTRRYGLFAHRNGVLERIATTGDPTPGVAGNFELSPPHTFASIDDGHLAFDAWTDENRGRIALFSDLGGTLTKVIGAGDQLFGKTVSEVRIGSDALSGNGIAFAAIFTDNTSGIYLATVPEPAGVTIAAAALALALVPRRRR